MDASTSLHLSNGYVDLSDMNIFTGLSMATSQTQASSTTTTSNDFHQQQQQRPKMMVLAPSTTTTITNLSLDSLAKMNNEWQFLQSAIHEAGLTDVYSMSGLETTAAMIIDASSRQQCGDFVSQQQKELEYIQLEAALHSNNNGGMNGTTATNGILAHQLLRQSKPHVVNLTSKSDQLAPFNDSPSSKAVVVNNERFTTNSHQNDQYTPNKSLNGSINGKTKQILLKTPTDAREVQMVLNYFLRQTVKQRVGVDFLVTNPVSEIPVEIMKQIKKEAFEKYKMEDAKKAWCLAKASLRSLRRELVKKHELLMKKKKRE